MSDAQDTKDLAAETTRRAALRLAMVRAAAVGAGVVLVLWMGWPLVVFAARCLWTRSC